MKKHDEGYVLAYVTVVLLVFCLVATTILTGAMRNLESQQNANEQMKAQYDAEGMIQIIVAQLENNKKSPTSFTVKGYTEENADGTVIIKQLTVSIDEEEPDLLVLTAQSGSATVVCKLEMDAAMDSPQTNVVSITNLQDYAYHTYQTGGVSE